MPYSFTLTTTIPASPQEVYEAWLDSLAHTEMTGGEANLSGEIGAEVSAWDGYISGRNLELVPGERIVQSWRTSEFSDEHEDSIITLTLEEVEDGTRLTLEHTNVPDEQKSYEEGGWQENYFEPMVAYFTERKQGAAETSPEKAAKKSAPKASPKSAPKRPAKSARKAKRAASAKSKRAAPRAKASPKAPRTKASPNKSKSKSKGKARRSVVAATARKRAKPATRKSARRKRK
ncbi:MAG: SRPBCC family protein [Xanthobacteraceae bacterium]|jgi:uncharacterized protein YndB with AHSA1/START domain